MIIDVRTHVWSSLDQLGPELASSLRARSLNQFEQFEGLPALHERAMSCVSASLVFGFRSERLKAHVPNELVADFVARDPARRLGIAGIDPMTADAMAQVNAAPGLGLVGVAVSPACQGFHPSHSSAMRVYERCASLGMPLFVSSIDSLGGAGGGDAVLEFGRPLLLDEVARAFPSLPIVIGQLGFPWIDEALVLLGKHRNVFADIADVASRPWQLYNALLTASSLGVMDKLLFASGFPFDTPESAIEALYSINAYSHGTQLPSVPRSQVRGIVERDSLECLGIQVDPQLRKPAAGAGQPVAASASPQWQAAASNGARPATRSME